MTTFFKGDLLILHVSQNYCTHLLVIHVLQPDKIYYCWDKKIKVYRLIHNRPGLHLLCPDFDPDFPSDIDWSNEWIFELYMRKYTLGYDPDEF